MILKKYEALSFQLEAALGWYKDTYQITTKNHTTAVRHRAQCGTWCWMCLIAKANVKFELLLKAKTKNVGVTANDSIFLLYLEIRQNIIVHTMINIKEVTDICVMTYNYVNDA